MEKNLSYATIRNLEFAIRDICKETLTDKQLKVIEWLFVAIEDIIKGKYNETKISISIANDRFKELTGKGFKEK